MQPARAWVAELTRISLHHGLSSLHVGLVWTLIRYMERVLLVLALRAPEEIARAATHSQVRCKRHCNLSAEAC